MKLSPTLSLALLLVVSAPALAQSSKKSASKPAVKIAKATPVSSRIKAYSGTWVLISAAGKEQGHTKIKLNPDGTFRFIGPSFGSEGKFDIVDEALVLTYLKSDGKPLKVPGKGTFQFIEDGNAFIVDRYKYGKHPYVPVAVPPVP